MYNITVVLVNLEKKNDFLKLCDEIVTLTSVQISREIFNDTRVF